MRDAALVPDPQQALSAAEDQLAELEAQALELLQGEQERAAERIRHLGTVLQHKFDERVSLRSEIEQRWLKSVRQINGQYEPDELPPQEPGTYGCTAYVPLTRRLRNLIEARLFDVLFPADRRHFSIEPGAVADLADVQALLRDIGDGSPAPGMPPGTTVRDVAAAAAETMKEAEVRAGRLQRVIDDRFGEARFAAKARRAISDAVDFGTGLLKGPVPVRRRGRAWVEGAGWVMRDEVVQGYEHTPLWNWFPDMSATSVDDMIDCFEVHPMTRGELQALKTQPGFLASAIDLVLSTDPMQNALSVRSDLRSISGVSGAEDPRYVLVEYHGPLKGSDLNACVRYERVTSGVDEMAVEDDGDKPGEGGAQGKDEYDDDDDYDGVVWFCNGVPVKAVVRPCTGPTRHIYSALYWQRDKASIFGIGLPEEVRDQQIGANSAYRAVQDHGGLLISDQIVVDDHIVKPVDGRYDIRPRKVWRKTDRMGDTRAAFASFSFPSHINELIELFNLNKSLMEEIATMDAFVQGSEAPSYLQSATGASLAYNASTLWVRRMAREWDDMLEPLLHRAIQWEMDHNKDQSIKGDFLPTAKGVSSLVELEGMGQRLMQFAELANSMGIPLRDKMRTLRQLARSLKIDPDETLPTEEEIEQMPAQGPSIEERKLDVAQENNRIDHEAKMRELDVKERGLADRAEEYARREKLALLELAATERSTLQQTAQKYGYDLQKLQAELASAREQRAHEAQMQNAETVVKLRTGSGL